MVAKKKTNDIQREQQFKI